MRQFNQVITVEVSVDSIAQKLLESINPEFKHAELLTEAIIGTSLDTGKISYLHNALNGYTNEIDFKVGDEIQINDTQYTFYNKEGEIVESSVRGNGYVVGIVKEIDVYKSKKLFVEMYYVDRKTNNGNKEYYVETDSSWVDHKDCNKIATLKTDVHNMESACKQKNIPTVVGE